ncbi:N-formylglutamate amidohydrolase [Curvibacter sp. RS43]|uniref:N-formylglutamate amidohydrolase n=1 Tax=Curvibacter microcysteis TaxID=3026419 RepID=UPI00235FB299|nr:N-formylglutamate amidohydrolase [Curvibacter sp. RS43]MDD0812932.1 N-formylglutamate amidohydrolase [Curvibacter sp. RS43]
MAYDLLPARNDVPRLPLVIDSPHSWPHWPDAVPTLAPWVAIRSSWDAHVDAIWVQAVNGRAPVLSARFHRSLIDANRARDDIDPSMLDAPWPGPLAPSDKSERGFGLIRRLALPSVPMYHQALPVNEVERRLNTFYDPYHTALSALIETTHQRFGHCLHLDCHSMKSVGNAMNLDVGRPRPDVVVSDLHGQSADPEVAQAVAQLLRTQGLSVAINDPYEGAELIRRHGQPSRHRHSVQIELNRALYMDEILCTLTPGHGPLVQALRRMLDGLGRELHTLLQPSIKAALLRQSTK